MSQDVVRPRDPSLIAQQLEQPFATVQASIRAFSAASDNLGAMVRLRSEVVVLTELVNHIGITLSSMADAADGAPDTQLAPGWVDTSGLAQALRAIQDLRELRTLS